MRISAIGARVATGSIVCVLRAGELTAVSTENDLEGPQADGQ
ncbi:hypothetical protein LI99_23730 [Mycolicibacterium smegmatis]|uniref:Uncharacterized protein n=1 Tax=Mycolicibacterium smegmatis (strain ATCC 700084 / mc(2)155) TaxID=246196 RepID=A0R1L5_MYCS2|nr:hypothetical protein MSMEG_4797 [Mycolicibacterium smegmatis MC2 155]AIU16469.1 hypothetical protein LI99_23730 [Mycolicibacterium smegmatis]AIU09844.1 hypothetical protein LJ00_23725 [Mycolicibacterium smegmatis MC2 155]AIU23092.1 hypothetical protein LI98_23735 [Mycolicibacterium smegmatis]TBH33754.1 hypothetical protein EYS45_21955 [Mycolicibacterium smegmatis MC2 155]